MNVHLKPRAGILLEVDLSVRPESYYYYYYYYYRTSTGKCYRSNYKSIGKGKISLLVLLDLSKAFDSVNRDLLLKKLVQLNIDSTRFASYLHDRTHSVKIDKIMTEAKSNLYRVLQVSILGPILLNIFINDIPKVNSLPEITTSTTIYADDIQHLFSGTPNNLEQLKTYA